MSQDIAEAIVEYPSFLQTFINRAQLTQIVYQTVVQGIIRNQGENNKGVPAADAELLHSLSAAIAALTTNDPEERQAAWKSINTVSNLALQFFPRSYPTYNSGSVGEANTKSE